MDSRSRGMKPDQNENSERGTSPHRCDFCHRCGGFRIGRTTAEFSDMLLIYPAGVSNGYIKILKKNIKNF